MHDETSEVSKIGYLKYEYPIGLKRIFPMFSSDSRETEFV